MSFNVGETVGPYRIIEQLGQGGMATVYKAYHASLDRYVAIKALHPAFNQEVAFESRFQREARVVAKLEHPNIVPVYDYAEHEKRPYLVMKFIEGITLKARMDQGPLSSDEVVRVVEAVGAALAYAHKQGVLHRDIKPSNVLLATDGQIYLADFGLARMAQAGESTLSSDSIMGTPQYISPEQAMGKSDLDQRTDLYSFGVMLYEMVVGKVPFSADTPFSIIHDHIYTPLPLPRQVNETVPEPVERVLLKALSKEREDRFDDSVTLVGRFKDAWNEAGVPMQGSNVSASQVLRAEEQTVTQPEPVSVATKVQAEEKAAATEAVPSPKKKRSRWLWAGAGFLVILCLCILFAFRTNRMNKPATPDTSLPGGVPIVEVAIQAAEKAVEQNPDDLDVQFGLVMVYWEAGRPRQAYEALNVYVQKAGPDAGERYFEAGDVFSAREAWTPAAMMYYHAVAAFRRSGGVPEELNDSFHEAVYKAASQPESIDLVQFDALSRVDEPIAFIAQARHALYTDRPDESRGFLEQARRVAPNMLEIALLDAEWNQRTGHRPEAIRIFEEIINDDAAPDWIFEFADEALAKMNQ